ncbi:hypothetical protein SAMD00019534_095180 [Acytostelium subglobosum LB1]|uniref:hypothetical protein n=1 Tax=Acytostelium subglobosum LB1 TaxID=1410327 RepID=UPI00064489FD|nr:hypothetical protein SAMD00019534_095180 [Acytostelium subglobosum LB1]GAM26343.1 hypothetical protein SAMD00019534_095180 [Acytostelium subglobosum LB1]|eukprot:XP_012750897.1 hypothetical protein SAMD00019534_095180 [Acytostelium subglobosum LB1]
MGNCCSTKKGTNGDIDDIKERRRHTSHSTSQLKFKGVRLSGNSSSPNINSHSGVDSSSDDSSSDDSSDSGSGSAGSNNRRDRHDNSLGLFKRLSTTFINSSEMKPLTEQKRHSNSQISISADGDFTLSAQDSNSVMDDSHAIYFTKPAKQHQRQLSTERSGLGPQFKTPLAIPQHMRMEGFQRAKHNSTSSLYIKSTLSTPDNDEILKCMANALLYHIERGTHSPQKTFEIFSEEKYPITKGKLDFKMLPTVDTIYKFLRDIFKAERLDSECAIMCLAYIERIITFSGTTISSTNWRRIVLSALILASKVWEDQSVWNVDFLPVFDNLTATDLNNLERQFLALIQYNVSLTASVYAKYYFELRTFSQLDTSQFPLKPLDRIGAKRLEDHSLASEYRVKTFKRSASVDQINPPEPHTRAVLN